MHTNWWDIYSKQAGELFNAVTSRQPAVSPTLLYKSPSADIDSVNADSVNDLVEESAETVALLRLFGVRAACRA